MEDRAVVQGVGLALPVAGVGPLGRSARERDEVVDGLRGMVGEQCRGERALVRDEGGRGHGTRPFRSGAREAGSIARIALTRVAATGGWAAMAGVGAACA